MKLYDAGLGILVAILLLWAAGSGAAADAGHPVNCKTNPTEVKCLDYGTLNK